MREIDEFLVIDAALPDRIRYLQNQYPEIDVQSLGEKDPSKGKYLTWAVNQVRRGADEDRVIDVMQRFHSRRDALKRAEYSVDINHYSSVDELFSAVDAVKSEPESELVYSKDGWTVTEVFTRREMCRLGTEEWCVARPSQPHWWDSYTSHKDVETRFFLMEDLRNGKKYLAYVLGEKLHELRDEYNESVSSGQVLTVLREVFDTMGISTELQDEWVGLLERFVDEVNVQEEAEKWRNSGLSLGQADQWLEAGITDPDDAVRFREEFNITPKQYTDARRVTKIYDRILEPEEVILYQMFETTNYNEPPEVSATNRGDVGPGTIYVYFGDSSQYMTLQFDMNNPPQGQVLWDLVRRSMVSYIDTLFEYHNISWVPYFRPLIKATVEQVQEAIENAEEIYSTSPPDPSAPWDDPGFDPSAHSLVKHYALDVACLIGDELGIDWEEIDPDQFREGLRVELEHVGDPDTDVLGDRDPDTLGRAELEDAGRVAWAHLKEDPQYYTKLRRVEAAFDHDHSVPDPAPDDITDAIAYLQDSGEESALLNGYYEESRAYVPIQDLPGDLSAWGEWRTGELAALTHDELFDELVSFRGREWARRAMEWVDQGTVPTIVVVSNPDGWSDVGDGRGRVSLADGLGWPTVPVVFYRVDVEPYSASDELGAQAQSSQVPTILYHGTGHSDQVKQFSKLKVTLGETPNTIGIWCTEQLEVAQWFARKEASRWEKSEAKVFVVRPDPSMNLFVFPTYADYIQSWMDEYGRSARRMRQSLIRKGYDGIEITQSTTDVPGQPVRRDFAIFKSSDLAIESIQRVDGRDIDSPIPSYQAVRKLIWTAQAQSSQVPFPTGMCHVTPVSNLESILTSGLKGDWIDRPSAKGGAPSYPNRVYLFDPLSSSGSIDKWVGHGPAYFRTDVAIIETDVTPEELVADEDAIRTLEVSRDDAGWTDEERNAVSTIQDYSADITDRIQALETLDAVGLDGVWSVDAVGTGAFVGTIPPSRITRVYVPKAASVVVADGWNSNGVGPIDRIGGTWEVWTRSLGSDAPESQEVLSFGAQAQRLGYRTVAYDGDRAYSVYDPSFTYDLTIGSMVEDPRGFYLGTTRKFVEDHYTGLSDDSDMLLTYEYDPADLLRGDPDAQAGGEIVVRRARLVSIEPLEEMPDRSVPSYQAVRKSIWAALELFATQWYFRNKPVEVVGPYEVDPKMLVIKYMDGSEAAVYPQNVLDESGINYSGEGPSSRLWYEPKPRDPDLVQIQPVEFTHQGYWWWIPRDEAERAEAIQRGAPGHPLPEIFKELLRELYPDEPERALDEPMVFVTENKQPGALPVPKHSAFYSAEYPLNDGEGTIIISTPRTMPLRPVLMP